MCFVISINHLATVVASCLRSTQGWSPSITANYHRLRGPSFDQVVTNSIRAIAFIWAEFIEASAFVAIGAIVIDEAI